MARLKDATFEGASLTDTNGGSSVSGTVTLDATSKIAGTYSTYHDQVPAYVRFDFTASSEVFITAFIYPTVMNQSVRTFFLQNGFRLDFRSTGRLRLQTSSGVQIGSESAVLSMNTLYRIGLHYKKGTGADGIARAYVTATGSPYAAFGAPFAESLVATPIVDVSRLDVGNTSGAALNTFYVDNIRIDTTAMPTDDVAGGTDTPMTVSATSGVTVATPLKAVGKLISLTQSFTASVTKVAGYVKTISTSVTGIASVAQQVTSNGVNIAKAVNVSVGNALSIAKGIGKPITYVENAVETIQKSIGKPISVVSDVIETVNKARAITVTYVSNVVESASKAYAKIISYVETPVIIAGRGFTRLVTYTSTIIPAFGKGSVTLKTITLTVGKTLSIGKNIGKPISRAVTAVLTRNTIIPKVIQVAVIPVISIGKAFSKIITRTVVTSPVVIYGKYFFINAAVTVGRSLTIIKNIVKPFSITEITNIPTALKGIGKSTSTSTGVSVTSGKGYLKLITVVKNVAVSYQRAIAKPISVIVTPITSIRKSLSLLIVRTVETAVDARKAFPMLISTVVGVVESVIAGRGYLRTVIRTIPVNVQLLPKQIAKVLSVVSDTNTAVTKGFDFIIEVTVNTIESFIKLASTVLGTTPFKRNVRSIALGFKNSTLSAFGKNTRTLTLKDTDNDSI